MLLISMTSEQVLHVQFSPRFETSLPVSSLCVIEIQGLRGLPHDPPQGLPLSENFLC